jgi:hypothetical protein
VNPRHVSYYKRMLGCEVLGSERLNRRVNAPAVLLGIDFAYIDAQIAKFAGKAEAAAGERTLYPYSFSIAEETGIEKADLAFVRSCSELLAYELPPEARRKKTGRGQVLYWFLFQFVGDPARALVATHESRGSQWMPFSRVLGGVTSFRKPMYARLAQEFGDHLQSGKI